MDQSPPPPAAPAKPPRRILNPLSLILILSGAFFVFFMIAAVLLFNMTSGQYGEGDSDSGFLSRSLSGGKDKIGVVELKNVIMRSKKMLRQLKSFEKDKTVKAVVLRINSPGGAVAPSQEIFEAVKAYKKPIYVSMGSVAASGGYYIAMGAKKGRVFANPGTLTGSIGVIMEFANLKDLYKWAKIKRFSIKSGKNKDIGSEYKDMRPEQKELLQVMIMDVWRQFIEAVSQGRSMPLGEVKPLADGRIYTGSQALKRGLVDGLKPVQDVIRLAAKEAGMDEDDVRVVYPSKRRRRFIEMVMDTGEEEDAEGHVSLLSLLGSIFSSSSQVEKGLNSSLFLDPGLYLISWTELVA